MVMKTLTGGESGDLNTAADNFGADNDIITIGDSDFAYTVRTYGGDDSVDFSGVVRDIATQFDLIDYVYLGAGNDTFLGGGGFSVVSDGAGDDLIILSSDDADQSFFANVYMGEGNDTIMGGTSLRDTITFDAPPEADASDIVANFSGITVDLNISGAQNFGAFGTDTITGIEDVSATAFDDTLIGNDLSNQLWGNDGNDTLIGGGDADVLQGGFGADLLIGGLGADIIFQGSGSGSGDVIRYESLADSGTVEGTWDTISDFNRSPDAVIDLSAIDANTSRAGNQSFNFIGTRKFANRSDGDVRIVEQDGSTFVHIDNDRDSGSEMVIFLQFVTGIRAADFIL